jgi:hypothetical protein
MDMLLAYYHIDAAVRQDYQVMVQFDLSSPDQV